MNRRENVRLIGFANFLCRLSARWNHTQKTVRNVLRGRTLVTTNPAKKKRKWCQIKVSPILLTLTFSSEDGFNFIIVTHIHTHKHTHKHSHTHINICASPAKIPDERKKKRGACVCCAVRHFRQIAIVSLPSEKFPSFDLLCKKCLCKWRARMWQ